MATVYRTIHTDPVTALRANMRAVDRFGWPVETRRQLSATFAKVFTDYAGRVQIDPAAADTIWRIGQSVSPYSVLALTSRASYVLQFGGDIGTPADRLKKTVPSFPVTWVVDAFAEVARGDRKAALASVRRGLALPPPGYWGGYDTKIRGQLEQLEKELSQ